MNKFEFREHSFTCLAAARWQDSMSRGQKSWKFFFNFPLWFFDCSFLNNVEIIVIIIWLARRAGKMNQTTRCNWLPERARWSHLARSGLPAVSRKQNFTKSHIINPLLTKFVRSRWLDIGLVLFLRVYGPRLRLGPYVTSPQEPGS